MNLIAATLTMRKFAKLVSSTTGATISAIILTTISTRTFSFLIFASGSIRRVILFVFFSLRAYL